MENSRKKLDYKNILKSERYYKIEDEIPHRVFYSIYKDPSLVQRGTILLIHGMQEHSGRYQELAEFLASKAYVVLCYDHIGHGKTAQTREELGFFPGKEPMDRLINDARAMQLLLEEKQPNLPHFVIGHSMGSFILRCLLASESSRFQGAVIVGTGGKTAGAGLLKSFLWCFNHLVPKKKSKVINKVFSQLNNKKFKNESPSDGTNWLSLSTMNRRAFKEDPLNGVPFSNNGFYTLIKLNIAANQSDWYKAIPQHFPLLFISGKEDPIGEFGKAVQRIVQKMESDNYSGIRLKLYPDMRHEILQEDIKEEVFQEIHSWISLLHQ